MEALGPGKTYVETESEQRGERAVCAPMSRHWAPRLQRGLEAQTGKQTEAQTVCVYMCVCVRDFIYAEREPRFAPVKGAFRFKTGYPETSAALYRLGSAHGSSCRGWHCVSWDLTRTVRPSFLPSASWCVYVVRWRRVSR